MQLKSKRLTLNLNKTTFGVESILINDDGTFFEWCGGGTFGLPGCNNFLYKSDYGEVFKGSFQYFGNMQADVTVSPTEDGARFEYCFTNIGKSEEKCEEGYLGVYLPFNNSVDIPEVTVARRANTHIRIGCGAYIYNARVNATFPAVGVVVTDGEVVCYAEERGFDRKKRSVPFFCLPEMTLQSGEKYRFSFELFVYDSKTDFFAKLHNVGVMQVLCDNYFPFDGEEVTVTADANTLVVDDEQYEFSEGKCTFVANGNGEKTIRIYGEKNCAIRIFVQDTDAYTKRAEFLCANQQIKAGNAKGAFTAYDNVSQKQIVAGGNRSPFNLAGYRAAPLLALLSGVNCGELCRENYAEQIADAVRFYDSNVYLGGDVADNAGKKKVKVARRYYTYPLYAAIKEELYVYGGEMQNLMQSAAIMLNYFKKSDCCDVTPATKIIDLLKKADKAVVARELSDEVVRAADAAIIRGDKYPNSHGLPYCIETVCGVAALLLDAYEITGKTCYLEAVKVHILKLDSFCFEALDYRTDEVPLVFCRDMASGFVSDKSPHFVAALCGVVFAKYARLSEQKFYLEKAKKIISACLALFSEGHGARSMNIAAYLNAVPTMQKEQISAGEDIIFYCNNLIFEDK